MSESAIPPDSWDILNAIAEGESARAACKRAGITHWALLKRLEKDEQLAHHYARAQQARAEKFADEIVQLADSADSTNWNAVRLQVDARKWVASKLLPKVYGDRLDVHESRDVQVTISLGAGPNNSTPALSPNNSTPMTLDVQPIPATEGDPTPKRKARRKRGPQGG